ncbi:hypothetical protein BRARA_I02028 [Brassica rapa]|uniref:Uncharacterized protein n=1 Tax=Brassica campestris TaxID=3711 RepID=A0A397Y3V5_BRACM|nr:hypothetical protein BRARA_I02028 [Brassica rapa]
MTQRSRCLKPSQKLKDMEWCTISRKGRRGREPPRLAAASKNSAFYHSNTNHR